GWASAVTVPISTCPKPVAAAARHAQAFLKKPPASPAALGNASPKTRTGRCRAGDQRVRRAISGHTGGHAAARPLRSAPTASSRHPPVLHPFFWACFPFVGFHAAPRFHPPQRPLARKFNNTAFVV